MATLHLINAAPASSDAVLRCFSATAPGDAIVFYEAGVLSAAGLGSKAAPPGVSLFVHRRDADALHVAGRIDDAFSLIEDGQLVSMVVAFERSVSWI